MVKGNAKAITDQTPLGIAFTGTAIIGPAILMPDGKILDLHIQNSTLIAGVVAALVAWRSKNLLLTIGIGMATLWLWRWLMG